MCFRLLKRALLTTSLSIFGLSIFGAAPAAYACQGEVFFRLWQPDGETWYDVGEVIQIAPGEEGHIYIHVKSRGDNPYSTAATIGYPREFGYQGDPFEVEKRVRMQAQNNDDRGQGRIRFRTNQQGQVQLGYRLNGVASPGSLQNVPRQCQTGVIPILVAPWEDEEEEEESPPPRRPGRGNARREAAESLVTILYEGILRREDAGRIDEGFVRLVEREGLDGLEQVAITMTRSPEFRSEALRRTEAAHGRIRDADELYNTLLWDIYGYLYGDNEPSDEQAEADFDDLSNCLDGRTRACDSLGSSLIQNELFEYDNSEYLEELY